MEFSKEKYISDFTKSLTSIFEELDNLTAQNKELEEKLEYNIKVTNKTGLKMKKYKAEVKELKAQLNNGDFSKSDVTEYEERLDVRNQEIQEFKNDLKNKDNQISKLMDQLNKAEKEAENWEEKYLNTRNAFKESDTKNKEQLERVDNEWRERYSNIETAFKNSDVKNKRNMELRISEAKAQIIGDIFNSMLGIKCELKGGADELFSIFKDHGLIEIPTEGVKFDPNKHFPLSSNADENFEEGEIIKEYNKGYMLDGVVVRKADVCVCKKEDDIEEEIIEEVSNNNLEFNDDDVILGIDLGRNNIMVATYDGNNAKLVPSAEGKTIYGKSFYSCVAFSNDGDVLLGEAAKSHLKDNPDSGISNIKGRLNEDIDLDVLDEPISSTSILSHLFEKVKTDAELFLGKDVNKAVFAVPFSFNKLQFEEICEASTRIGLEPVSAIFDPIAIALANGFNSENSNQNVLCYDLEGDKVYVSVLSFGDGKIVTKKAVGDFASDKSINEIIVDYLIDEFKKIEDIDLGEDERAVSLLTDEAEKVKIGLSNVLNYDVNIAYISADAEGNPLNMNISVTRDKLNDLIGSVVAETGNTILMALDDAKIARDDIDNIVLAGGHSRMPIVKEFVSGFIGKSVEDIVDPMEAVAIGAAIKGYNLAHDDVIKLDL